MQNKDENKFALTLVSKTTSVFIIINIFIYFIYYISIFYVKT